MKKFDRNEIIAALEAAGVRLPCPRCGNSNFSLEGYVSLTVQSDPNTINLGGPAIPSVATVCSRCGHVSLHALGALGLLPEGNGSAEEGRPDE